MPRPSSITRRRRTLDFMVVDRRKHDTRHLEDLCGWLNRSSRCWWHIPPARSAAHRLKARMEQTGLSSSFSRPSPPLHENDTSSVIVERTGAPPDSSSSSRGRRRRKCHKQYSGHQLKTSTKSGHVPTLFAEVVPRPSWRKWGY
jgi:hypothetical protein